MYYLDAQHGPIKTLTPVEFINAQDHAVTISDFYLPAAYRLSMGIWPLELDPRPDEAQFEVIGETYEKLPNVMRLHWVTRQKTQAEVDAEQAQLTAAALDDAITAKCTEIDAYRASLCDAGIPYGGKVLQLRKGAQHDDLQNIIAKGAAAKFALLTDAAWPENFAWIMADNSTLPLTAQQMSDMADAADAKVTAWIFRAAAHKAAVRALTSVAAVEAYDYSADW